MTHDPSRYPPGWRVLSLYIRFVRAGGRCECRGECATRGARRTACAPDIGSDRCLARHGQPNPRTGSKVILTVAHLDDDPSSDDERRLRAFCQACHLAYDTRLHAANRAARRSTHLISAAEASTPETSSPLS